MIILNFISDFGSMTIYILVLISPFSNLTMWTFENFRDLSRNIGNSWIQQLCEIFSLELEQIKPASFDWTIAKDGTEPRDGIIRNIRAIKLSYLKIH